MADVTLRSYDPFAYYVNNVSDLDPEVVKAHKSDDIGKRTELLSKAKGDYDLFICVNKYNHAFVLCVPCGPVDQASPLAGAFKKNPSDIPDLQLCWRFELCFENQQLRMYKIRKEFSLFKDIVDKINKSYHIGTYKDMSATALQFAALRSAPQHYNVLLHDCVEFSKEFCLCLLSYCSNWKTLEKQVHSRIGEASATGLSIEKLSRRYRTSGILGSLSLQGGDVTTFMTERNLFFVLLFFLYPIIVAVMIVMLFKYF